MGYGITDRSQIIDARAINEKLHQLKSEMYEFDRYGQKVVEAGEICTNEVLSLSGESYHDELILTGEEMENIKTVYCDYIDQLVADTNTIYNAQVDEYNQYLAILEQQRIENENRQNQQQNSTSN